MTEEEIRTIIREEVKNAIRELENEKADKEWEFAKECSRLQSELYG